MKLASRMCCTVVVLGDSRTGKSALIRRFVKGEFKEDYSPTSFDKSFATQEVDKHQVDFSFWDTSGSPAYDSVRSLTYHEANVFLLCYKISDPISLYNVKNKWIGEIRKHRPDAPVVLCGCQADLRHDSATLSHLGRTGRTPVSLEQALAICCEVGAVHYVETSAKRHDKDCNLEAFDLCALATMKQNKLNNNSVATGSTSGVRRPGLFGGGGSISSSGGSSKSQSSTSLLFDQSPSPTQTMEACAALAPFKRSPSTNSNLSLNSLRTAMPPPPPPPAPPPPSTSARSSLALALRSSVSSLQSPSAGPADVMDFPRCRPVTSPEPNVACRIPPVISENEAYHTPVTMQTFSNASTTSSSSTSTSSFSRSSSSRSRLRPSSVCDPFSPTSEADLGLPSDCRLQRPTTLFSAGSSVSLQQQPVPPRGSTAYFSPGAESAHKLFLSRAARRFESASVSELGSPTSVCSGSSLIRSPQLDVVPQTNALIRPQFLSRRTSYRTHPKMSIPVATPTSPLGSTVAIFKGGPLGSSVTSPLSSSSSSLSFAMSRLDEEASAEKDSGDSATRATSGLGLFDPSSKIFESLKSHAGSISEDESSSSSGCSVKVASDLSESSSISCHAGLPRRGDFPVGDLPDTEDPQLLRNLNFVSPKAGVYRPSQGRKTRANCLLM